MALRISDDVAAEVLDEFTRYRLERVVENPSADGSIGGVLLKIPPR
jgi:hypothetical protein